MMKDNERNWSSRWQGNCRVYYLRHRLKHTLFYVAPMKMQIVQWYNEVDVHCSTSYLWACVAKPKIINHKWTAHASSLPQSLTLLSADFERIYACMYTCSYSIYKTLFHARFMGLSVIASFMRYLFEITSVYRQIFTSLGKWTSRKYGRYNLVSFMIEHFDFSGSVIVY